MRTQLRPFQTDTKLKTYNQWELGKKSVLVVSATGSGKTVLFSDIILDEQNASCAIAHRQELVSQISLALARNGVRHRIIGSDILRRTCTSVHMSELNANYVDPNSRVAVAGVDTLIKMPTDPWFASVKLVVMDEAHHVLRENKWGKAASMFPNARVLGVTATPCRADGKGLGAHADGIFDTMVIAPGMRDIINMQYLTDYRVFVPPSDLDLTDVPLSESGDFSPDKLRKAVHRSHVTGDVVAHYLKIAPGRLGITFAVDIESATDIAKSFREAGVPAEVVSSKTPDLMRIQILKRFKRREILQLVNVDLFGEGFDLPAIEVVSFARPTQSYSLYVQQFGRTLRILLGKNFGIIIDHVGNVRRHGLPDKFRDWSLDRRDKRAKKKPDEDVIPIAVCVACASAYERIYKTCPYCNHSPVPAGRTSPAFVDGDLCELTTETLIKMRGEIDKPPVVPYNATPVIIASIRKNHWDKSEAQRELRDSMQMWAGWKKSRGMNDSEIYRMFYLTYGMDILSAQTLNMRDAEALTITLESVMRDAGVV